MLDFNHRPPTAEHITQLIDHALQAERNKAPKRNYLGASILGGDCARAMQFQVTHTQVDPGREIPGRSLRIFEIGHVLEDLAVNWLRLAGFKLLTTDANQQQFGFSVCDGRLQGHVDGVFVGGPAVLGLRYPMLFECKSMADKYWTKTVEHGVAAVYPQYAAQMALYQAYLADRFHGIARNPAFFLAINKNDARLHIELVPFDGALAQATSDRGVRVLCATDAQELLPRVSTTPTHPACKRCPWQDRCWDFPD